MAPCSLSHSDFLTAEEERKLGYHDAADSDASVQSMSTQVQQRNDVVDRLQAMVGA